MIGGNLSRGCAMRASRLCLILAAAALAGTAAPSAPGALAHSHSRPVAVAWGVPAPGGSQLPAYLLPVFGQNAPLASPAQSAQPPYPAPYPPPAYPAPFPDPRAQDMLIEGAQRMLRGLELLIRSLPTYDPPVITPEGDIIIRRHPPLAPRASPAPEEPLPTTARPIGL